MDDPKRNPKQTKTGKAMVKKIDKTKKHTPGISTAKIRSIVKDDTDVKSISTEACLIVAGAVEMFVTSFAKSSAHCMLDDMKETVMYDHVADTVANSASLNFLDEIIPRRISASEALVRMNNNMSNNDETSRSKKKKKSKR